MENITIGDINHLLTFIATLIGSITAIATVFYKLNNKRVAKQQEAFRKEFQLELKKQLEPFDKRIDETIKNNNKNHNETKAQVDELKRVVDFNDIDAVRSRIVAFENLCRMDKNYNTLKLHQFKTIYKDINKWKAYHIKYPELNGEIDIAIESINEHYKKEIFD